MGGQPTICEKKCACFKETHATRLVVVTGGPGAGKTAVLETAKKVLCEHVAVLPEAASIVFNGGFWRLESPSAKAAAQRAIYHVQREMENLVLGEKRWAIGLCDRGTLDGLAYWKENETRFWEMTRNRLEDEFARYAAVIHLRSPSAESGYNHQNPLRVESAIQAKAIDDKIFSIWSKHPQYKMIESAPSFLEKARLAIHEIAKTLPDCCRMALEGSAKDGKMTTTARNASVFVTFFSAVGFLLNFAWEYVQCEPFFRHIESRPSLLAMSRATLGDVLMMIVIYLAVAGLKGSLSWFSPPWTFRLITLIAIPSFVIAVLVEFAALSTNRWEYTSRNPVIPWLEVSLLPILQMLLIAPISFYVSKKTSLHFANTNQQRRQYETTSK
jgi:predicted ATPase